MNSLVLEKRQLRSPYPSHLAFLGKKEGYKKRTQAKSYTFISHLSFWQKSTLKKRTLTDELPTGKRSEASYVFCFLKNDFINMENDHY